MEARRLDGDKEAALASQLDALLERLAATEGRLDELVGRLGDLHPDDVARVQAIAEDGLARAGNAQAIAEDALGRMGGVEGAGVDALARADNAQGVADEALKRLVEVEGGDVDALARATNAQQIAEDALGRIAGVEVKGEDALARSGNAQQIAEDALGRTVGAEAAGVDALARADNAQRVADEALKRLAEVESGDVDALARATNAQAIAEGALERIAGVEGQSGDALARAGNAQQIAEDALGRTAAAEGASLDASARADNAQRAADEALARIAAAEGQGENALARADHAQGLADDALQRAAAAAAQAGDADAAARVAFDSAREALLPARMAAFGAWLELCPPIDGPLVSVILPTRDRPALLPRAVASLLEQLYDRWELVVVDDGDTDAVEQALAGVEDERVVVADGPRRGLGAARNAGLDAATGDIVCYLDDDNVMHPLWLLAVAHVFTARTDVDVAYGVTLAEHRTPGTFEPAQWWPAFWQLPWSRQKLLEENLTDAGALAHRRELPEARFDEAMGEDWDLLIRLTADRPALAVPAISHAYAVGGDDHMSRTASHRAALEEVRRRHAGH
jgi:hypothetical protein